jgi:hypothetical protein
MGDTTKIRMGVCNVLFNAVDLGYTKGFVKCSFTAESIEQEVDQEDAAIDELITKQNFEVEVPLAEYDLSRLADLLPNATYTLDTTKEKVVLTGAAGASLKSMAQELIIKPLDSAGVPTTDANEWLTLKHAVPRPNIEFAYEKENLRVYSVTFRALKGVNGYVIFGDETAV